MYSRRVYTCAVFLIVYFFAVCKSGSQTNDLKAINETETVIDFLSAGAREAVKECRRQFMWDRWHCPIMAFTEMIDGIPATREESYAHAITSASIVNAITKSCSSGLLEECSCRAVSGIEVEDYFKWQGCSDNVDFPSRVARQFFQSRTEGQVAHAGIILHNLQTGRIAVRESLERTCKCHGSSGSCTIKTCWLQLKELSAIGRKLKKAYRRAIQLEETNTGLAVKKGRQSSRTNTTRGPVRKVREIEEDKGIRNLPLEEVDAAVPGVNPRRLVYLDRSPDYCVRNDTAISEGTARRLCAEGEAGVALTKAQKKSCLILCHECKYAIMQKDSTLEEQCNCKFVWCCEVHCEKCRKTISSYSCLSQASGNSSSLDLQ